MNDNFITSLNRGLEEIKINLTHEQVNQFDKYGDLLIEWNQKINLTAITEPDEVAIKHFVDSLMCLQYLNFEENYSIIDIGTGAGFPGLPIKISQEKLSLTLLDSLQKRCNFLQNVVDELKLKDVQVIHGRAEEKGQDKKLREKFNIAFARAVTNLPVLVEYCLPFVKVGGFFVSLKGPDVNQEIADAKNALKILGGKIVDIKQFKLPIIEDPRSLIIIEKTSPTPKNYPRKAGLPAKKPL